MIIDRLLTVAQAAEFFGTSERFPRRLIAERRIQSIKVGRHVRFREETLREFVEANAVDAVVYGRR